MEKLLYDAKLEWDLTDCDGNEHNNQIIAKGLDLKSIAFLIEFYSWDNYLRIEISKNKEDNTMNKEA